MSWPYVKRAAEVPGFIPDEMTTHHFATLKKSPRVIHVL
jgi:hypothetical protein